jgi:aminopeptidase N
MDPFRMMLRTVSASLLLVLTFASASTTAHAQRLPTNARPTHYTLAMTPDIKNASFAGTETIDLVLAAPAKSITLNAIELKLLSVSGNGQTGDVSYHTPDEQVVLTFPNALPAGSVALKIAFTGVLNDKLRGFYLSRTKTRNYAVTQFEATDARRAFPCFDEPALKATFDVSLTVAAGDTAISNTNIVSDTPAGPAAGPGEHTLVFAETPKMSTYLVAFLVGDFACTKGSSDGVPIRVCSTPDKVELTGFALEAAEHFLHYYDTYFGIKYPMPKLDLIGIPDFEAGAMENFGAITYRETALLVDQKDGPIGAKKRVAVTVAHEMAHQWFGDMVTMQWWNNLWLNEGFATWMENKAAGEWHPEWHFEQDVADDLDGTLNYDAVRTTRPIRAEASTPAQISEMFDGIAYGKAGAVIGMVENWIGPDVFRQGVHNYLAAHLFANATAEDFWNAQTAVSKKPVDRVMSSFVTKPGVPLLTFKNREASGFPVAQSRFYLDGASNDERQAEDVSAGWTIPVCVKTTAGTPDCRLLTGDTEAFPVVPHAVPFLYANAGDKGYYRTQYSPAETKAITAVAETDLSVPERIGFVGDRWALTRAGKDSVGDYLDLVLALKIDPNSVVLDKLLGTLNTVRTRIATPQEAKQLNAIIQAQFGPIYAGLGADAKGATYDQQQVRSELYGELGNAGDPAVLAHARQVTDNLFAGKPITEPDIVDTSVALAAENGDDALYDRLLTVSQRSPDPSLGSEALSLLTRFRSPILEVRTLEYATSGEVRNQDSWILIAEEISQPETRDLAWAWVQKNWPKVQAQLTTASGADLVSATGSFCTVEQRDQVQSFFTTHKVEAADRTLSKALDSINACIALRQTQEPRLRTWLASH